jgi:hypothetical protein
MFLCNVKVVLLSKLKGIDVEPEDEKKKSR